MERPVLPAWVIRAKPGTSSGSKISSPACKHRRVGVQPAVLSSLCKKTSRPVALSLAPRTKDPLCLSDRVFLSLSSEKTGFPLSLHGVACQGERVTILAKSLFPNS
jgi:hypothetical protein